MDEKVKARRTRYSVEVSVRETDMEGYMARFRDCDKFMGFCRECPMFGRSWACPPFDFDAEALLGRYARVSFLAARFEPLAAGVETEDFRDMILPDCGAIERFLLEAERRSGGRAFINIGRCRLCGDTVCRRSRGEACLHPDKVRPSLEAYGFDVGRTLTVLFGIDLKWSSDGTVPGYMVLVTGLFHDAGYHLRFAEKDLIY